MNTPDISSDNSIQSPTIQIGLYLFGHGCWIMSLVVEDMTISDLSEFCWKWGFRALSLLSLIFIIAINRKKGVQAIKEWWSDIKKFFKR